MCKACAPKGVCLLIFGDTPVSWHLGFGLTSTLACPHPQPGSKDHSASWLATSGLDRPDLTPLLPAPDLWFHPPTVCKGYLLRPRRPIKDRSQVQLQRVRSAEVIHERSESDEALKGRGRLRVGDVSKGHTQKVRGQPVPED